jgi:hypothetical protein
MRSANAGMTLFALMAVIGYIGALCYFWNYILAVAAGIVMAGRLPDLIWEVRTGQQMGRSNAPQGFVYIFGIILMFAALPVVWFSLYH